ncbi:class I SAM-dependent methyltransferase [Shewanella litorisediminis]|uniref:SAM-dependent methyltransferase n=1 Tax=Shewanella litorisediminis TaxID=1173586 RepID=A0ABX7G6L7_9GAMM|nr:SAM-dependent methyltransferase [Shewanella litorisediminis]MCL2916917.1 SAM-dependent methyltransferase [Shewanella litorisediminis]QRH02919.1 SAM-dependent methyltransferase [Shewanella litorisediminis]
MSPVESAPNNTHVSEPAKDAHEALAHSFDDAKGGVSLAPLNPAFELQLLKVGHTLSELAALLIDGRALWDIRTFNCQDLPWAASFPALASCVLALEDEALEALDASQDTLYETLRPALETDLRQAGLSWNSALFTWRLTELNGTQQLSAALLPERQLSRFAAGIKGRKWEQISRFAAALSQSPTPYPVLEWCAGKGHLGRLVGAVSHKPVLSLEWQAQLCQDGEKEAQKRGVNQRFVCADAFSGEAELLQGEQHALALHACGELHLVLLRRAAAAQTSAISLSPCCYHLIQGEQYAGLSASARATGLVMDKHGLQLPLNHSVVASAKENQDRLKEVQWRLGFDSLQRHLRGEDTYLPLPSLRQSQLSGSFDAFCRWACELKGVPLPEDFGGEPWLALGRQRQRLTRRLDLVAHLFRPVIEQYLLLDRAAYLLEAGYRVSLSAFCPAEVTPRNALIDARRP